MKTMGKFIKKYISEKGKVCLDYEYRGVPYTVVEGDAELPLWVQHRYIAMRRRRLTTKS